MGVDMKTGIFITGTDTGVGKTFVSGLLLSAATNHYSDAFYFKPIQTGDESDTQTVQKFTNLPDNHFLQPCYHFPLPASPNRAAQAANAKIEIETIIQNWQKAQKGQYIIEGAGGIMVPLYQQIKMIDLIKELKIPVILVSSTRLGTINHTLLTLAAIELYNIPVYGIILNGERDAGLADIFAEQTDVPVLAEIPQLYALDTASIRKNALQYFSPELLNKIFNN